MIGLYVYTYCRLKEGVRLHLTLEAVTARGIPPSYPKHFERNALNAAAFAAAMAIFDKGLNYLMTFDLTRVRADFSSEATDIPGPAKSPSHTPLKPGKRASASESRDDYPNVLFCLSPSWRVIVCRDGIQWILQHRRSPTKLNTWEGTNYNTSRLGLERNIRNKVGVDIDLSDFLKDNIYD
jgi:hypothetical protein